MGKYLAEEVEFSGMGRINQLIPLKFQRENWAGQGKSQQITRAKKLSHYQDKGWRRSLCLPTLAHQSWELFIIKTLAVTHTRFHWDSDSRVESTGAALAMEQFLTSSGG